MTDPTIDTPKRRGRTGRPTKAAAEAKREEAVAETLADPDEIDRLAAKFEAESDLDKPEAKKSLARALAEQFVRHRRMIARDLRGELSPDVARTLPAVARTIERYAKELGLTSKKKKGSVWG